MEWWGILIIEKAWLQKWNFKMKFQYDSPPSNSISKKVGILCPPAILSNVHTHASQARDALCLPLVTYQAWMHCNIAFWMSHSIPYIFEYLVGECEDCTPHDSHINWKTGKHVLKNNQASKQINKQINKQENRQTTSNYTSFDLSSMQLTADNATIEQSAVSGTFSCGVVGQQSCWQLHSDQYDHGESSGCSVCTWTPPLGSVSISWSTVELKTQCLLNAVDGLKFEDNDLWYQTCTSVAVSP